mgnify:CR=1 FL=1
MLVALGVLVAVILFLLWWLFVTASELERERERQTRYSNIPFSTRSKTMVIKPKISIDTINAYQNERRIGWERDDETGKVTFHTSFDGLIYGVIVIGT